MPRVHKPWSSEQVKFLPYAWLGGRTGSSEVREMLGVGRTRFFDLFHGLTARIASKSIPPPGEISRIPFSQAVNEGSSLFRPFALPKLWTSPKHVFCLRESRLGNGYRRSLFGRGIPVPWVPGHGEMETHLVPHEARQLSMFASGGVTMPSCLPPSHSRKAESAPRIAARLAILPREALVRRVTRYRCLPRHGGSRWGRRVSTGIRLGTALPCLS
jgi:hypothetical protein